MAHSLSEQRSRRGDVLETIPLQDLHRYRLIVQRGRKMMVSYLVIYVDKGGWYRFTFDTNSLASARTNYLLLPRKPKTDMMLNRIVGTGEPLHILRRNYRVSPTLPMLLEAREIRPFLQVGRPVFTVTLGDKEEMVDTAGVLVEVIRMEAGL